MAKSFRLHLSTCASETIYTTGGKFVSPETPAFSRKYSNFHRMRKVFRLEFSSNSSLLLVLHFICSYFGVYFRAGVFPTTQVDFHFFFFEGDPL
jgi:hypothetical protein